MRCALVLALIVGSSLAQELAQLNSGIGDFSVRLLKETQKNNDNIILSAFSISSALGMTLLGAKGQTQTEMQKTMGLGDMSISSIKRGFKTSSESVAVMTGTPSDDAYVLSQANRLYANESQPPSNAYKTEVQETFNAAVETVNFFQQEATKDLINEFVKKQTKDLIPNLLGEPLATNTILALVNALYFKGVWQKRMEDVDLPSLTFKSPASDSQTPQWMNSTTSYNHGHSKALDAVLIDIPYMNNPNSTDTTSMIIVLPDVKHTNITSWVESQVTWPKIEAAIKCLKTNRIQLTMPKFKVESSFDLGSILEKLGMPLAFSNNADFGNIYDNPALGKSVQITKVIHKATMTVDEKGTEAAAATAVIIGLTSIMTDPALPIIIDRPFLALIVLRSGESRVPLFTSIVNKL